MDAYDGQNGDQEDGAPPILPPADFDFLIYSLRLQAELNLGILPMAEAGDADLELARHNIDLLAMLQDKTRGNLTDEESRELGRTLSELRMRFVQAKEQEGKGGSANPFLL